MVYVDGKVFHHCVFYIEGLQYLPLKEDQRVVIIVELVVYRLPVLLKPTQ